MLREAKKADVQLEFNGVPRDTSFVYIRGDSSGIGNQILSTLSALQLAEAVDASAILPDSPMALPPSWRAPRIGARARTTHVDASQLLQDPGNASEFLNKVRAKLTKRRAVIIFGPMLGSHLVALQSYDQIRQVQVRSSTCPAGLPVGDELFGAVHFRFGDFIEWDPTAVLPSNYYLDAIIASVEKWHIPKFIPVFDDYSHPALPAVTKYLRQNGLSITEPRCAGHVGCDFALLRRANIVISSPSTFAISAVILGRGKAIQSATWTARRAERGDIFWSAVRSGTFRHYRVAHFA